MQRSEVVTLTIVMLALLIGTALLQMAPMGITFAP
jgi:hypothetical protein